MIVIDFVVNVSRHRLKTNFYRLQTSWCSNRSMKYERNRWVSGLYMRVLDNIINLKISAKFYEKELSLTFFI